MPVPRAFDFTGEVAVVSGAGSRLDGEIGNGRATAILLARQGVKVALLDNNVEWAEDTKSMIDAEGGGYQRSSKQTLQLKLPANMPWKRLCSSSGRSTFLSTLLIHNRVGVGGTKGDVTQVDLGQWDRDWKINVTSMILMSRYTIPEMRKNGRGAIVNLSSVSGLLGGNPGLLYPTSKGAIVQMTRAMAAHHGKEGIPVNCVAPGMAYTPLVRGRGMTDEMRKARIGQNLLGIEGTGWDVGHAILFLCSKEARWITGLIMPVDAGTTAGRSDRPALMVDTLPDLVVSEPA